MAAWKLYFLDTAGELHYELTPVIIACTRSAQAQVKQNGTKKKGNGMKSHS